MEQLNVVAIMAPFSFQNRVRAKKPPSPRNKVTYRDKRFQGTLHGSWCVGADLDINTLTQER